MGKIARDFEDRWNYPFCVGALDGKHFSIKQPAKSGSEYYNYKNFFSVILLALVDANYRFLYVDVGAPGRAGDAGGFNGSSLKKSLDDKSLNLPSPATKQGLNGLVHYHIVGDDAFSLRPELMKPFPQRSLETDQRVFNYRLSRARRVVENAFGILSNRFRVFLTTIQLEPARVNDIILVSCCLHNYIISKKALSQISGEVVDNCGHHGLAGLLPSDDTNPTTTAKQQRMLLKEYFSSAHGCVPWQNDILSL